MLFIPLSSESGYKWYQNLTLGDVSAIELLQMVAKPDNRGCVSEEVEP